MGPKRSFYLMQSVNLNVAGMIAVGLVLVGCSSAYQSGRANLERSRQYNEALAYSQGPMATRATVNYRDNSISTRLAPQRASRPRRPSHPLRRFAAMPRHKPHAPHVRQHEGSCLRSGIVQPTRFVRPRSPIGGGSCYISKPFRMFAAAQGQIRFEPAATLRCQMVPSVETWVRDVLRPAARRYLGSDVVRLRIAASYACRSRNSKAGARLSEHGKANAIDISKFFLANGRVVTVKHGWRGSEGERRFLRYVHRGACEHFSTVLGPNADRYHHDHFHFDLARHGRHGTYRVCK
mgnify:FL=1